MSIPSGSPYDVLIETIRNLEEKGLTGMSLWWAFVAEAYPSIVAIADACIKKLQAQRVLECSEAASITILKLQQRFAKKQGKRKGNRIFGNYRRRKGPLCNYLVSAVDQEIKRLVLRQLSGKGAKAHYVQASADFLKMQVDEENHLEKRLQAADVLNAVTRLPRDLRRIVMLRYYKSLSVEKIAQRLHIGRSKVYEQLRLAYESLKPILRPTCDVTFPRTKLNAHA